MAKRLRLSFSSIRTRILFIVISLVILISGIITCASFFVVSNNLQQNLFQTSETRLSFLCASIDSNISSVKSFIRSCQTSSKITAFAMEESPSDNRIRREAHDFVMDTYYSNVALTTQLIRLVVIGRGRDDIVQAVSSANSSVAVSKDTILSLPYFEKLLANNDNPSTGIASDPFFTTRQISMIPFVYTIYHPYMADEIGYIFTEMSTSVITEPANQYLTNSDNRLFFCIGDSYYQYESNQLLPCEFPFEIIEDFSAYSLREDTNIQRALMKEESKAYFMITKPLDMKGWTVIECVDANQLSTSILKTFSSIVLIIILAASFIGIFLFWFLQKTVTIPVSRLQNRIARIEQGDFSRDPSTEWNHELGEIGKTINNLSENVFLLMNQRIEDEKQKKDYEYKMLQSQINPHFLYNTLNSIKWMATIQNAPGIAEMTTSLSRLLKDISKGTKNLVSIGHELDLIRDYFTIQQYRYGGTITMDIQIDDDSLLDCEILKFTLQPLVENAIFHGIEPKGTAGKITIQLYQTTPQSIRIDVSDDGIGIEPETLKNILDNDSATPSSFFKEIGISNVHKRLQYEFGEEYGLSINSIKGEFTTISILLPLRKSEEIYDKAINRR